MEANACEVLGMFFVISERLGVSISKGSIVIALHLQMMGVTFAGEV